MTSHSHRHRLLHLLALVALLVGLVPPIGAPIALASHTPNPTSVTIAGSFQSEVGCSGDWQPECAITHLTYDASDDVWHRKSDGCWRIPVANPQNSQPRSGLIPRW